MKKIILLCFTLSVLSPAFSQDSLSFRLQVDSILNKKRLKKPKRIDHRVGELRQISYWRSKGSNEICAIKEFHFIKRDSSFYYTWVYLDGQILLLRKAQKQPNSSDLLITDYYFKDNELVYKQGDRLEIENLRSCLKRGYELKETAPKN